jgi:hypothetical protein
MLPVFIFLVKQSYSYLLVIHYKPFLNNNNEIYKNTAFILKKARRRANTKLMAKYWRQILFRVQRMEQKLSIIGKALIN